MILARTELATIDALRASGEEPERILELIESIVNKGIDTGRFDMCHVETDPEAALRLAEALLGTNRYPAFARAMRILEAVTPYVEDRSDGMLLFTLSTIARLLCGRPFDAAGRAVSGIGEDERDVRLLYLLGILRAGEGRFDEAREWLLRADVESPDDPVILHALELVAARESLERILLTRPLWEDGDLDHTAPGTPERALRMACVELDPDGYADALIALNATGLELDDESFLRMEVELSGHAVPFVFEMNHAGLSKMDPAWLARLVESVSDVLEHAKAAPEHLVEVRARLDRSVRLVLTKPEPDTTRPSAIDYSFEVPSRCPRIEGRLDTGPEEAAVLKHLRALDLRGNLDEIIRRLEAVPKEKFTPLYAFELARAIANRSESGRDDLKRALALLEGLDDRTEGRWETLFCRAFLNLRLGQRRAALKCFKACAGIRPDDEVVDFFVEVCKRGLSQPTIEKPFRVRADEVWAALEAQATELEDAFDSVTDADEVEKRLAAILEPVSASWWRLDVSAEDERIKVEISPNGWRLECFPILEFLRRVPESLADRWTFTAGRARRDDTSFETFMAGNEVLSADDVLIWPEPHEGMWRLLVYIEDFKGTEERARIECFQAVRALIDRTVGEAARLRRADAITLVPKAPSGEGLTLSEFREFLFEKAPECRRMTLKDYAWLPHEYGMRPDTRPGAPLLADVTEGITHCPPLGYLYGQGKSIGMDALGAAGACAGFLFLDVKDDAEGLAPKKDRRIKARKMLEVRLRGLGDGYLDVVGHASGVRYEYLQFIAWDLSAVLECASAALKDFDDVVEAGFHTYLRDASVHLAQLHQTAAEAVHRFHDAGFHQAIISASQVDQLRAQVVKFPELDGMFDDILGLGDVYAVSKVQLAKDYLSRKGYDPADTVFLGDTSHDAEVARAIGCRCLLISGGHQCDAVLRQVPGVEVLPSLRAAADVLGA